MQLTEKYRPSKLEDLVGQAAVVKRINLLRQMGGLQGRVLWLCGPSGSGKTSCARIIAEEIADSYATIERDAMEFTMEFVRDIERMCQCKPLGRGCWVFICNESHGLSDRVLSRLQTTVEIPAVQRNATFIFTTTNAGQKRLFSDRFDAAPFLSRAVRLDFESNGEQLVLDYACHVRKVAQTEGCDGQPIASYIDLVRKNSMNLRACLNAVESGALLS